MEVVAKCLHFVISYSCTCNKKRHTQTLKSALSNEVMDLHVYETIESGVHMYISLLLDPSLSFYSLFRMEKIT